MNSNSSSLASQALVHQRLLDEVWNRYLEERGSHEPAEKAWVEELDASCLPITDISGLREFPNLRFLDLSLTEVEDLSPLAELPHLRELHLTFHRGVKLEGLEKLTQLRILDLSYPRHRIPDLGRVGYLDKLEELYLNGCGLSTIAHVVPLDHLKVLTVSFNRIPSRERDAYRELNPACALLD